MRRFVLLALLLLCGSGCSRREELPVDAVSFHRPLPPTQELRQRVQQVILISIDGLRPDALGAAPAPVLLDLIRQGTYCPAAETVRPTETLPAHASLLTGLTPKRHGVTWNDAGPQRPELTTVLRIASEAGLATAALYCKEKFRSIIAPESVHWTYGPPGSGAGARRPVRASDIAEVFEKEWAQGRYALTFLHLGDPDAAGHQHGWMSKPYLQAVQAADQAVGRVVATLKQSGTWERSVMILTSDHGGHGRGHSEVGPPCPSGKAA